MSCRQVLKPCNLYDTLLLPRSVPALLQLPLEGRQVEATLAKLLPVRSSPGHFSGAAQLSTCCAYQVQTQAYSAPFCCVLLDSLALCWHSRAEPSLPKRHRNVLSLESERVFIIVCICGVCVCGVCASYPSIWCTDMPSFRQTNTPQTDREWERGRERLTGENTVKTMQTRLNPGAEREQGARVVGAFVFRFYIQVDFIYSAKATTKKWFITLGREPRLLSWLWQAADCAPCHASLPSLWGDYKKQQLMCMMN